MQGSKFTQTWLVGLILACCFVGTTATRAQVEASDSESGGLPLSMAEAIRLALQNNRTLEKAGLDRESQRFDLRVAEDEFRPNLDLIYGVGYNPVTTSGTEVTTRSNSVTTAVTQRLPTGARFGIVWDNFETDRSSAATKVYDSNMSLQFDQPLLRGGGLQTNLAGLRIARLTESTNVLEYKKTIINAVTSVIYTYRALLQSQRQVEVTRSAVEKAREQLRINRALVSAGTIPPVEIVQTEADIASGEFNYLTAQSIRDTARLAMVKILDVNRSTVYHASDELTLPQFNLDFVTCLQLAYANRPDYQQALESKQIATLGADAAKNGKLWSLNLSSRFRLAGTDSGFSSAIDRSFSRLNEDWNVGLTLQVPIGDLTRRQNYIRARIKARKAGVDVTEITENIEIEVRNALRTIDLAERRVKVAGVVRELSERKLEIEKGKLQVGRTTNFAIITFQNDLVSSRLNEIGAQITYLNALTNLEQVLGTTLDSWGIRILDFGPKEGPAHAELTANP